MTIQISAQDFRNAYERFYADFRNYLWPYVVLEELAKAEVEIYTAFIDTAKLRQSLLKLSQPIRNAVHDFDDLRLQKSYDRLMDLLDIADPEHMYHLLNRVKEVNPGEDKQIKSEDNEEEFTEGSEGDFQFR